MRNKQVRFNVSPDTKERMKHHEIDWSEYLREKIVQKLDCLEGKNQAWCHR